MASSAYGARPQQLKSPVPDYNAMSDEELIALAAKGTGSAGTAKAKGAAPVAYESMTDEELLALAGQSGVKPGAGATGDFAPAAEEPLDPAQYDTSQPGFIEANLETFSRIKDRALGGLAQTNEGQVGILKKKYGDGNATLKNGEVWYRKSPEEKLKRFDPDAFEIVNDLIADNMRSFLSEAAKVGPQIAGAATGARGGALLGPKGAATGAVVGGSSARMAATPTVNKGLDLLAAQAGAGEAPTDDVANQIEMAFEGLGPVAGLAFRFGKRFVPGTAAHVERQAEKIAKKSAVVLNSDSKQILSFTKELEAQGIIRPILGENLDSATSLAAHQLNPDNPVAMAYARKLKDNPTFQNFQTQQGEMFRSAIVEQLDQVAKAAGKGPVPDGQLAEIITDAAQALRKSEGAAIQSYKNEAIKNLKNKPVPLPPELSQHILELGEKLGFSLKLSQAGNPSIVRRTVEEGTLGLSDPGKLKGFQHALEDLLNTGKSGALKITDLDRLVTVIGDMHPTAKQAQGSISQQWGKLASDLRAFRRQAIESGLPDDLTRKAYNQTMDSFSGHIDTITNIADSINTDMGANAVIRTVFSKSGKEAAGEVRNLRAVLQKSHPEAWDRLKGEYIDQLVEKHITKIDGYKPGKLLSELSTDAVTALFDGQEKQLTQIRNLVTVAERVRGTKITAEGMTTLEKEGLLRDVGRGLTGSGLVKVTSFFNLFGIGKTNEKNALREIITKEGVEQYLGQVPPKQRAYVAEKLNQLADYTRWSQVPDAIRKPLNEVPGAALYRSATTAPMQEAQAQRGASGEY